MQDYLNCKSYLYDFEEKTLEQLLNKFFDKINNCIDEVNLSKEFWEFVKTQGLKDEVIKQVEELYNNGKLSELINKLASDVNLKVEMFKNELNSQLEQNADYNVIEKSFVNNKYKIEKYIHIMAGMDSLTNGGGGTSWCEYFRNKAFAQLGCGGVGYIGFHNTTIIQEGGSWSTTLTTSIQNTEFEEYSLDRKGVSIAIGGKTQINYNDKEYDNARIIYLKHPNGGSFDLRWLEVNAKTTNINTYSENFELGFFDLTGNNALYNGRFIIENITQNNVIIFGAFLTSNNGGLIFSRLGMGGEQFKKHAQLNDNFREKWIDLLNPDYLLFNGGTNDEQMVQATEYGQLLEKYIRSFLNKNVKVTLIMPNNMKPVLYLPTYEPILIDFAKKNKCSFVSHGNILGSFESASARGLQLDGCHPNQYGNEILCGYWLNRFGLSNVIEGKTYKRLWINDGATSSKQYTSKLTEKNLVIENGTKTSVYNLGFVNAYTNGTLKLNIHMQNGYNSLIKEVYAVFQNNTVVNNCNAVGSKIEVEKYRNKESNINSLDFTVSFEIVSNKLLISITSDIVHSVSGGVKAYFNIDGIVSAPYVGTTGKLVYEN